MATKKATKRRPAKAAKGKPIRQGVAPEEVANRVAVATAPVLARLLGLPKWLVPILALAMLFGGLALGGVGGLLLLWTLAGFLGWFLVAFWPVTPTPGRVLRALVVLGVLAAGLLNL
ncbi:MAG: DUF6703 family protein [Sporichthyaceae bacterium]